ncbi:MAG: FxsA cytoplasmic rane protein, partial [Pseudomonadota bacterium]
PIANGLMSVVAGVLLMLPGFFTDALGLVLLIPPVRRAIISGVSSRMMIRPTNRGFAEDATDWTDPMHPRGKATGDIIDGDYYEVQPASRAVPGAAGTTKH